jgi:hypothetical protein
MAVTVMANRGAAGTLLATRVQIATAPPAVP